MGVSGCGKHHVGALLAYTLGLPFIEGERLHSPASIDKIAAGMPLGEQDRAHWLAAMQAVLLTHPQGCVLACSGLQRRDRDLLREARPALQFVHLDGSAALDPLQGDEAGVVLSSAWGPSELVAAVIALG